MVVANTFELSQTPPSNTRVNIPAGRIDPDGRPTQPHFPGILSKYNGLTDVAPFPPATVLAEELSESVESCRETSEPSPPSSVVSITDSYQRVSGVKGEDVGQSDVVQDLGSSISSLQTVLPHEDLLPNLGLGTFISTITKRLEQMEDLDKTALLSRHALKLCSPGHPDRSAALSTLALTIHLRFLQAGRKQDLGEAVELRRRALRLCPLGNPDRCVSSNNLAGALHARFEQIRWMPDLEEAILLLRQALATFNRGTSTYLTSLTNIASALHSQFQKTSRMLDWEEAVGFHQKAVEVCAASVEDIEGEHTACNAGNVSPC